MDETRYVPGQAGSKRAEKEARLNARLARAAQEREEDERARAQAASMLAAQRRAERWQWWGPFLVLGGCMLVLALAIVLS